MKARERNSILLTGLHKGKYGKEDVENSLPAASNFSVVVN
jgi:hypothetical protein